MTTYTPGPWTSEIGTSEEGPLIWPHTGKPVAQILGNSKKSIANARLIAAAPDLLEALQRIVDAPGMSAPYYINIAKEAIIKATKSR